MNTKKLLLASLTALLTATSALADLPFRNHRYDSFKVTPTDNKSVVFVGNSITNMHSWGEAFGDNEKIVGRGNSGGFVTEILPNLESFIDGAPEKFFLMIGTNDISGGGRTESIARQTAERIRATIRRVQLESPTTEIYIQSILPRSGDFTAFALCNSLVKEYCQELGVNYVDLTEACALMATDNAWSLDRLHPQPKGYAAWTRQIQDQVGAQSVYPDPAEITTYNACGASGSHAMRVAQFPFLPTEEGDILIFGDDNVHAGLWNELLRLPNVKDRGTGWGTGGLNLTQARQVVASAISSHEKKPSKIFLFYGEGGKDLTNYRGIIDEAKTQAPDADIYVVSLTPRTNSSNNAEITTFNDGIKAAAEEKGVTYIDVFTPMLGHEAQYVMPNNHISGLGYILIANEFAKYIPEANPVTVEEANAIVARRANRSIVGDALTNALMLKFGTQTGQIKEERRAEVEAAIAAAAAKINNNMTTEEANAAVAELNAAVAKAQADTNRPVASTDAETHWYVLTALRGSKVATATGGELTGSTNVPTTESTGSNIWKLVQRTDNTYDIVSATGQYINPNATYNTTIKLSETAPEAGWTIDYSNYSPGSFVIYSAASSPKCQLNQTAAGPVYNWYHTNEFPDHSDDGCVFSISDFTGQIVEPKEDITTGWHRMEAISGIEHGEGASHVICAETEKYQNSTNSYALMFAAPDADHSAREYVYITVVDNTTWKFASQNGHGVNENATSSRAASAATNTAITALASGNYMVGRWNYYEGYIGKYSSKSNEYSVTRVPDEELAALDIWNVTINSTAASEVMKDARVTLNSTANRGIPTVYNGGTYFLDKGTIVTPAALTPVTENEQPNATPAIKIDNAAHTITVDYTTAPNPATSLTLSAEAIEIIEGETATLTATVLPADADYNFVQWSIDNETVATIDANGLVTSVAPGNATVTATCADLTATCTVTVTAKPEESSIETIGADTMAAPIYDLQGRRVIAPARAGLYIQNGQIRKF